MKLVICVDDSFGYSFNHRRQSFDKGMRRHLRKVLGDDIARLYVNDYSERSLMRDGFYSPMEIVKRFQIPAAAKEAFLSDASEQDAYAFVENVPLEGFYHCIDEIYLYQWDKRYPSDLKFPQEFLNSFDVVEEEAFSGTSHDEIRFTHYRLKTGSCETPEASSEAALEEASEPVTENTPKNDPTETSVTTNKEEQEVNS